ncbi:MAG: VTT domain-containing protein [Verrucomicrobiales bacterium]
MKSFIHRHRHRLAICLIVLMLVGAWFWQHSPEQALVLWHRWVENVLGWVRSAPFPLFIVLVGILPMVGVPVTAMYLAAGAVYSPVYGLGGTLGGICLGLMLNLLLSYYATQFFRAPVDRLLRRFGASLPDFSGLPAWKVILLVRITPGAPLMVQNLLLGLAGLPIRQYLIVSMAAEIVIALGYLTAGHSFATGEWGFLPVGVALVVIAVLVASLLRDRMKQKNPGK